MPEPQVQVLSHLATIGQAAMKLQRLDRAEIQKALPLMRLSNPEIWKWLVSILQEPTDA
jgi:hypothetical protein